MQHTHTHIHTHTHTNTTNQTAYLHFHTWHLVYAPTGASVTTIHWTLLVLVS